MRWSVVAVVGALVALSSQATAQPAPVAPPALTCPAGATSVRPALHHDPAPGTPTVALCGVLVSVPADATVRACQRADGAFEGPFAVWRADGTRHTRASCRAGKADGTLTSWYPSGRKQRETSYIDGLRDGLWTLWGEDGKRRLAAKFRRGRLHGTSTSWFANGGKADERSFRNGRVHGRVTRWHSNGRKQEQSRWVDGKLRGKITRWDPHGKRLAATAGTASDSGKAAGPVQSGDGSGGKATGGHAGSGRGTRSADQFVAAGRKAAVRGDFQRALRQCEKALGLDPDNQDAAMVCVIAACNLKHTEEAIVYIRVLRSAGRRGMARQICEKQGVRITTFHLQRAGRAALDADRFREAAGACEAALDIDPARQDSLAMCAVATCRLGDLSEARSYFHKVRGPKRRERVRRSCRQLGSTLELDPVDDKASDSDTWE